MDALRRSGRPYALLHFADFDCPGCRNGARDLALLGGGIAQAGGAVVEVLITQDYFSVANRSHLDAWVATYDLTVTSVIDASDRELESYRRIGIRETTLVVDLSTMKVVWRLTGDLFGIDPSSVSAGAAEILARLP
jgi:hypothetical protein